MSDLEENILTDESGKKFEPLNERALVDHLGKKALDDFINNRTIVVDGWILSVTEAMQCSILFLNQ